MKKTSEGKSIPKKIASFRSHITVSWAISDLKSALSCLPALPHVWEPSSFSDSFS